MKKDDALVWRERLRNRALAAAVKQGFPTLAEDGKLYHDEVAELGRWATRLSPGDRWPHLASTEGHPPCPGLRYEVWYFAGKQKEEELLLALLCSADHGLEGLQRHLRPTFQTLIEGGKYARRYRPNEPIVASFYPDTVGICRRVPLAKAEASLAQLLDDTLKPVDAAFGRWEGADGSVVAFRTACNAFDPMAALRARFGPG